MSIRVKVFLIIMAIVLVITASSVVISVNTGQRHILQTLETDMSMMAELANEYITGEIAKLEYDASSIAHILKGAQPDEMMGVLMDHIVIYPDFMAISVFNSHGTLESAYPTAAPSSLVMQNGRITELAQRAYEGDKIITSTIPSASGMILYVIVPMDDYRIQAITGNVNPHPKIIVLTVDAAFFIERVKRYNILQTGHITILDSSGKIIANVKDDLVMRQVNFLDLTKENSQYNEVASVVARMIDGKDGVGRYSMPDAATNTMADYIVAYKPMTPSSTGWLLSVFAPVAESSYYEIRFLLIISGLVFFGLGMIAAALASGVIARPFEVAKELAKAKTGFLANLSHDMRTPLNVVIGLSDVSLTARELPPDVQYNLERIYGTGINLLGVVNDLLDISNMDSGKFGIMHAEYDVPALLMDTVNTNLVHIGPKPISFVVTPDANLPVRLIGDGLRIRQVFNNLLSNALYTTGEGTVEWRVSVEKGGDSLWLVSSVSDNGPGIKPEDLGNVFMDYSNQDTSQNRSVKGAGLSLALTKRMVDMMQGTISVASTAGKGTTFTVRLPQKYVNDKVLSSEALAVLKKYQYVERRRSENAGMERLRLSGKRVLVVEDGPLNLEVARRMIEPYGITVDGITSGQEAADLVRKAQPLYDAVFIPRMMAEMDGRKIVESIRTEIGTDYAKNVPIIALTTNTVTGNIDIFLKWGFQDVLSKPLDIHRLDAVIRRWVAKA